MFEELANKILDIILNAGDSLLGLFETFFNFGAEFLKVSKDFFYYAGQICFDILMVDSISDVIHLAFVFMGIAAFLLLVKLILWFMGG